MNKKNLFSFNKSLVFVLILLLPSCKWISDCKWCSFLKPTSEKKETKPKTTESVSHDLASGTGAVLCSFDGKVVIRESGFKSSVNQMLQANPYFKGVGIDSLPGNIKKKLFEELVNQEIIIKNAEEKGVYTNKDFIKEFEKVQNLIRRSLVVQFFEKNILEDISVKKDEVMKNFEENKAKYVKVSGGILSSGIKFEKEDVADNFLEDVKDKEKDFEKLAKDNKDGKFKDFGRETQEPQQYGMNSMPAPIKEEIFKLEKFPTIKKVKVGKDIWIVFASDKKETVYYDLEEISPQIETIVKNSKFKNEMEEKIKKLKLDMNININDAYFMAEEKKDEKPSISSSSAKQKNDDFESPVNAAAA